MFLPGQAKVYIVLGATDMRKAINGLASEVSSQLEMDPYSGALFVFCNRGRDILKVLYWDRNGFCLWNKRLEKGRFRWPKTAGEVLQIGSRELSWLLSGLGVEQRLSCPDMSFGRAIL